MIIDEDAPTRGFSRHRHGFCVGIPGFIGHLARVVDRKERVRGKQHDVFAADGIALPGDDAPGRKHRGGAGVVFAGDESYFSGIV